MKTNQAGLDLIKEFEGWVDHWYPDPATNGEPYTCCYGHTAMAGEPRIRDLHKFTKEEGEEILRRDLTQYEVAVSKAVTRTDVTPNQFSACVSLCYNIGPSNFSKSTLVKKLNIGDIEGAAKAFLSWNKAAGKVMDGLTRRRKAEKLLFEKA